MPIGYNDLLKHSKKLVEKLRDLRLRIDDAVTEIEQIADEKVVVDSEIYIESVRKGYEYVREYCGQDEKEEVLKFDD